MERVEQRHPVCFTSVGCDLYSDYRHSGKALLNLREVLEIEKTIRSLLNEVIEHVLSD